MRVASAALTSLLGSRQPYWSANLVTISLTTGATIRLTTGDRNITFGGNLWLAASAETPAVTCGQWQVKNTLDVPSFEIDLISTGTDWTSGSNIKLALHNGLFDGAWIEIDRAFMPAIGGAYGNMSLGTVPIFAGRCGQIEITALGAKITVRGANVLMQQYMPRNRYMLGCIRALYDAGCALNRATYTFSGSVASANAIALNWEADPTGGNFANLALGYVTMTSGVALGSLRTIQSVSSSGVVTMYPFYEVPSAGDTFTVTYGCDKTLATCTGRFANQQHFRGFPFVPPAETAAVA